VRELLAPAEGRSTSQP